MLEWMFWRYETAILFGIIFLAFIILTVLDFYRKSSPRKGFLPIYTTRGDRFFLGMIFIIIIGLLWLGFVPLPIEWCLVPALADFIIVQIWG